jgi:hypothetical protein
LNTRRIPVDKKTRYHKDHTGKRAYKNVITIKGSMDAKGLVTAEASVKSL